MHYRARSRIVADLLTAVRDLNYGGGVSFTALMRRCNLSYGSMKPLVSRLVGAGLLREEAEKTTYRITQDGLRFLREWRRFDDFARSYGVAL